MSVRVLRGGGGGGGAARGSASALPEQGATLRRLRQWLFIVFAAATLERIDLSAQINSTVKTQEELLAKGRLMFDRVHDLTRPASADTIAKMAVVAPRLDPPAVGLNVSTPAFLVLGGEGSSSGGQPTGTSAPPSGGSLSRGSSSRKRRREADVVLRCDVCAATFDNDWGWGMHLGKSSYCREAGAEYELVDKRESAAQQRAQRAGDAVYASDTRAKLVEGYGALQYDRLVDRTAIQSGVKEGIIEPLCKNIKEEILRRLGKTPAERESLEKIIGTVFDVHAGIESTAKEEHALKEIVEPVTPKCRELVDAPDASGKATGPRRGDCVWDVPIDRELKAMVDADAGLLEQIRRASDAWAATRPEPGSSTKVYADIADGAVIQGHSQLGSTADRSDGSVRLAFILYYDDLEVVNPLGAFHGTHKLGMFLLGIGQHSARAAHGVPQYTFGHCGPRLRYRLLRNQSGCFRAGG